MRFNDLLRLVGNEPVFESALLLAGDVDPVAVRLQLSRWTRDGKIVQLRRGLYALAPPYQKVKPHPFLIANRLRPASYVSCQSALGYYGLLPDIVHVTLSVTGARPWRWETTLGDYQFRHIKHEFLRGYHLEDLGGGQAALLADREKAILDLLYLQPRSDAPGYIQELRLQNLEFLDLERLDRMVDWFDSPKIRRCLLIIKDLARIESEEYPIP
jgi:predicted transcriptional regulator of viral defense system